MHKTVLPPLPVKDEAEHPRVLHCARHIILIWVTASLTMAVLFWALWFFSQWEISRGQLLIGGILIFLFINGVSLILTLAWSWWEVKLKVLVNDNGEIVGIYEKKPEEEILRAPERPKKEESV